MRPDCPTLLPPHRTAYFAEHVTEEVGELIGAETVADQVDALCDIMFIASGRLYEMGVDAQAHWDEVCRANGSRVRGNNAKRPNAFGYDAVKPEGWTGPDHERILNDRRPPFHFIGEAAEPSPAKRKVILLGHARHGKDTVAEMLRDRYGYRFESSSWFLAERVVMPHFDDPANGLLPYADVDECFEDRVNHRALWFDLIEAYNHPDRSRLARELLGVNDVYVGMRSKRELAACRNAKVAELVVWVDASDRLPPEDASSCTVEPWMADLVLDNNGTLEELALNLYQLVEGQGL